jgi:hypothetical protein
MSKRGGKSRPSQSKGSSIMKRKQSSSPRIVVAGPVRMNRNNLLGHHS